MPISVRSLVTIGGVVNMAPVVHGMLSAEDTCIHIDCIGPEIALHLQLKSAVTVYTTGEQKTAVQDGFQ